MGRIKFRVDANSAKKKVMAYVDQNDEKDAQRALKNHPAYVSGSIKSNTRRRVYSSCNV